MYLSSATAWANCQGSSDGGDRPIGTLRVRADFRPQHSLAPSIPKLPQSTFTVKAKSLLRPQPQGTPALMSPLSPGSHSGLCCSLGTLCYHSGVTTTNDHNLKITGSHSLPCWKLKSEIKLLTGPCSPSLKARGRLRVQDVLGVLGSRHLIPVSIPVLTWSALLCLRRRVSSPIFIMTSGIWDQGQSLPHPTSRMTLP